MSDDLHILFTMVLLIVQEPFVGPIKRVLAFILNKYCCERKMKDQLEFPATFKYFHMLTLV